MLRDGSSFLDIGAEVGIAAALAARTPAVRVFAIELDPLKRGVLRTNLALVLKKGCVVLYLPDTIRQLDSSRSGPPPAALQQFESSFVARFDPGVIRVSNTYAESLLPILGGLASIRCVVVATISGQSGDNHFPLNLWNAYSPTVRRGKAFSSIPLSNAVTSAMCERKPRKLICSIVKPASLLSNFFSVSSLDGPSRFRRQLSRGPIERGPRLRSRGP